MSLPIGSVINYWSYDFVDDKALVCDGTLYERKSYPDLFDTIGGAFGNGKKNNKSTHFRVPDLRGMFVRGTDKSPKQGAAGVDPDADKRQPMALGGNLGNAVGSIQIDSLASHTHGLKNTVKIRVPLTPQFFEPVAKSTTTGTVFESPTHSTYGIENRPMNAAFVFVIVAAQSTQRCPLGSIVAFGGIEQFIETPNDGDVWVICDGTEYRRSDYPIFYNAFSSFIGSGNGETTFNVPDLRGYFLRGSADATTGIGTKHQDKFQSHTHGLSGGVTVSCFPLPTGSDGMGLQANEGSAGTTDLSIGCKETRPINAYLHFIIRIK